MSLSGLGSPQKYRAHSWVSLEHLCRAGNRGQCHTLDACLGLRWDGQITEREREAETEAEGEAGSMHREPDVGFDPGSPGSRPGPKAGAKPLRHPGIPSLFFLKIKSIMSPKIYNQNDRFLNLTYLSYFAC
ncbi:unnamed protein product [Nyctereutes procyonoides]|uniref:(raccoon dog) hypothetical protein n=1 Tax=Nyctereutes procyonoides TaxID=34880 RepID=A0A811YF34_NYCPR|nr:unnamed protein product [Nyctereutes procyonoides]